MRNIGRILGSTWLCAALCACAPHHVPSATIDDLMEDRVALDGLLMKCNQDPSSVRDPADCERARIASERLALQQVDPSVEKKREEDFEKARQQLRLAEDKKRQEQEARAKVDPYTLPVIPVDAVPKSAPSYNGTPPPTAAANAH